MVVQGSRVEVGNGIKYLRIYLDKRLTWNKHIKEMAKSVHKSINLLRAMAKVSWSAYPMALLMVYKGLTRSYLEWGCQLLYVVHANRNFVARG